MRRASKCIWRLPARIFVVARIEQAQLLAAMDGIKHVVNVEHDAGGHMTAAVATMTTMARPIRSRARASGRFSRREMIVCEDRRHSPAGGP